MARIRSDLKQDPRVRVVLPRIQFSGLISNGDKSAIYMGTGIDPRREFTITGPFMQMHKGEILTPTPEDIPGVMLAKGLARSLKSEVGSVLTLLTTTSEGSLNGLDVQVTGIFGTGVPELDKRKLFVDTNTAQALLLTQRVSTLSAYLYETSDTQSYQEEIKQRYPVLATRNWSDLAFFYHKVRNLYDRIFTVVGLVILAVVLLSVVNTMSMAVIERTREIGTMAALGTLPGQVLRNFIIEAIVIGTMGSVFGMLLTGSFTVFLEVFEVMMPPPPGMTTGYPLRLYFSAELYAWTVSIMVSIAVLGAYVAAIRGVKRPIVDALGHV